MKKMLEIPAVLEMADFHSITEVVTEEYFKKRLMIVMQIEIERMIQEIVYYNPNDKSIA